MIANISVYQMQRLNGFDLIYFNKERIWWQKLLELIVRVL
jgi:hypothetical protein